MATWKIKPHEIDGPRGPFTVFDWEVQLPTGKMVGRSDSFDQARRHIKRQIRKVTRTDNWLNRRLKSDG